jgi:hypothetical protein
LTIRVLHVEQKRCHIEREVGQTDTFNCIAFGTFGDLRHCSRVPRSTAYVHLRKGDFKSRRIGGRRLIDFESVRAFFEKAPTKPPKGVVGTMKKRAAVSARKRKRAAAKNGE